jgi:hypothetical protein
VRKPPDKIRQEKARHQGSFAWGEGIERFPEFGKQDWVGNIDRREVSSKSMSAALLGRSYSKRTLGHSTTVEFRPIFY